MDVMPGVSTDEDNIMVIETMDSAEGTRGEKQIDQPWAFWKWLIPIYASVLCIANLLSISFWVTVFGSTEFLLYIGDDNKVIWDLLPTLPPILMLIEWPFNMIPFDWPMLIFVECLFSLYMFINFLIVTGQEDHENVYEAFNWYTNPIKAIVAMLVCYVALALEFAVFWWLSNKWKLPKYQMNRETSLFGSFSSSHANEKDLD